MSAPRRRAKSSLAAEWALLALLSCTLVAAASAFGWFARLDRVAYDAVVAGAAGRPASQRIVLVAIDEDSLADIGRWPWSRAVHAEGLSRITQAAPAAVLLDLILAEPDGADPSADEALAAALVASGRTVLPVYADVRADGSMQLVQPHAMLARAAAALGHIHLELDADGVARRVWLLEADGAAMRLPHLAQAALSVARGASMPGGAGGAMSATEPVPALQHQQEFLVPFTGPPGHYRRVSYSALLRGEVAPQEFAGHIVLIGATATGLGDAYPTPVSGRSVPMPGVELMAHVIHALDEGRQWREAPRGIAALASVLPVLLLLALLPLLSARAALQAALLAMLLVAAGATAALLWLGWWLPPAAALIGLVCAYPLWSWRRLEAASRFLQGELAHDQDDATAARALGLALPRRAVAPGVVRQLGDRFEQQLGQAGEAAHVLRRSRAVLAQSLAGLPAAVVVCDPQHQVFIANDAARALLGLGSGGGARLPERLAALELDADGASAAQRAARWQAALAQTLALSPAGADVAGADAAPINLPLAAAGGRAWLVSMAPYARVEGRAVGSVISLTEVTELQRLEREEREFLQFLSHDLRAPQNSVLSLVDLARAQQPAAALEALLARIERHAERSLALIDALLMQQRAGSVRATDFRLLDLAQIAHQVADTLWPQAQARGQRVAVRGADGSAFVRGSSELIERALGNLAHNASKYGGEGVLIEIELKRDGAAWRLAVRDNGPGIAAEHLPRVFERHFRAPQAAAGQAIEGSGLGLAFVKTVAERHGGAAGVTSDVGRGSTFTLHLPACDDDAAAHHDHDDHDHHDHHD